MHESATADPARLSKIPSLTALDVSVNPALTLFIFPHTTRRRFQARLSERDAAARRGQITVRCVEVNHYLEAWRYEPWQRERWQLQLSRLVKQVEYGPEYTWY